MINRSSFFLAFFFVPLMLSSQVTQERQLLYQLQAGEALEPALSLFQNKAVIRTAGGTLKFSDGKTLTEQKPAGQPEVKKVEDQFYLQYSTNQLGPYDKILIIKRFLKNHQSLVIAEKDRRQYFILDGTESTNGYQTIKILSGDTDTDLTLFLKGRTSHYLWLNGRWLNVLYDDVHHFYFNDTTGLFNGVVVRNNRQFLVENGKIISLAYFTVSSLVRDQQGNIRAYQAKDRAGRYKFFNGKLSSILYVGGLWFNNTVLTAEKEGPLTIIRKDGVELWRGSENFIGFSRHSHSNMIYFLTRQDGNIYLNTLIFNTI